MKQLESPQSRKKFIVITLIIAFIIVFHFSGSLNAVFIEPGSLTPYGYYNPPYGFYIPNYGNYIPPYNPFPNIAQLALLGLLNNVIFGGFGYSSPFGGYSPFGSFGYGGYSPFGGFGYGGYSPFSGFGYGTSYFDSLPNFVGLGYSDPVASASPYLAILLNGGVFR